MRETSSSSVISRVTRSASASMVSIISRFWSSVKRSHRRSSVEEKPFTDVSGDRSSWATVEMTAAFSASARRRYAASRIRMLTRLTGWLRPGRRYFAVTRTSRPLLRSMSSFSRWPVRIRSPPQGSVTAHQDVPSLSCRSTASRMSAPTSSSRDRPRMRVARRLRKRIRPSPSAATRPSGISSAAMPADSLSISMPGREVHGADLNGCVPPQRRRGTPWRPSRG